MPQPKYFQNFSTYDLTIDGVQRTITDLSQFVSAKDIFLRSAFPFYSYIIQDGERPDHVAFKHYGDTKFYWIILITNNIHDIWHEWPMDQKHFNKYMGDKYGGTAIAKNTILKYFRTDDDIEIDRQTYLSLPAGDTRTQNAYDYEQQLNEAKRNIKLIKREYIADVQAELKQLFE